jgi:N-acylneuraminate cytidylyltransferase/CMP-N,N'-diacetyllegionaminic acid synthase
MTTGFPNEYPKVLGVITARGGSKGLPGKNVRMLVDKPLIAYTIEAARNSAKMYRWLVSTDDEEIAEVSRQYGADVPFSRPAYLARDTAQLYEPLRHALQWVEENEGWTPDYVLGLQATTPLRTGQDIDDAIEIAVRNDADSVIGYAQARQHPFWMKKITDDGRLVEFLPVDPAYLRRQNLPAVYHVSGSIYLIKREVLMSQESFYTDRTYPFVVPLERDVDIDTYEDFRMAELILNERAAQVAG